MSKIATERSFSWSDLARRSGAVGEAIEAYGTVTVVRGSQILTIAPVGEPDVVEATRALAHVLTKLVETEAHDVVDAVLSSAWPWTRVLPAADRIELAKEIAEAAEVSGSVESWHPFSTVLADWRRTARAWSEGVAPTTITEPRDEPVPRPR